MTSTPQDILDAILSNGKRTIEAEERDARLKEAVSLLLNDVRGGPPNRGGEFGKHPRTSYPMAIAP